MPFVEHAGARLYWKGDGELTRPPLLLLNSIGTDLGSWDRTLPYLLPHFRTLRMDTRGHGASDAPAGEYSLDLLAGDALAVLNAAGVERALVCGVSLGGMTAATLALTAPERVRALILACTSPKMDTETWRGRIAQVKAGGMAAIADAVLGRFLSPAFTRDHPEVADSLRAGLLSQTAQGYVGCGAAIRDMDLTGRLGALSTPTLVIGGEGDVSTPSAEHGRLLADAIPAADWKLLDAPHLAQVEAPSAFAAALTGFVQGLDGPETGEAALTLYESGLWTRRRVLGDAWVDRALANRTPFNSEFQAMITRIAWQEIWTRPGLDHRTRRLLVVAITAALGRWEEFRLHVRSGLERGGFTEDELKETLMQLAIYAGVPAANTAFAEAADFVAKRGDVETSTPAHRED